MTDTPRSRASPLPQGISIWPAIVDISISDRRFCLFLRLAARRLPLRLPKRAILVGQSLPPTFHPAEAILSCAPICVTGASH
ncbi:hypothetical protein C3E97_028900 [Pseudomonas sp. MWU12-2115]|nr:hypothetical protein C3E97_028900 [Pseudomonas sp. MWU12-2115]